MTDEFSLRELTAVVDKFMAENEVALRVARESLGRDGWETIHLDPTTIGAATLSLYLTPHEVVATVGAQGRFEMGQARDCLADLGLLLAAVRDGRVQETIKRGGSKVRVHLADGRTLATTDVVGLVPWAFRGRARLVQYGPYDRA
jgi:hypothetical protein